MKDNESKEFCSSGHFWLAVDKPRTSDSGETSVSPGNEWRSALAPGEPATQSKTCPKTAKANYIRGKESVEIEIRENIYPLNSNKNDFAI